MTFKSLIVGLCAALALTGCVEVQVGPSKPAAVALTSVSTAGAPNPRAFTASLNNYRAQAGRPAVVPNPRLIAAAQAHARDMASQGYFSHRGKNGSMVRNRVRAQGYDGCFWAENLAMGQTSEAQVLRDWAASPGHNRNLLSRAQEYGLGRVGDIWVLVLGSRCAR